MTEDTKEYIRGYKAAMKLVLLMLQNCNSPRAVIQAIEFMLKD